MNGQIVIATLQKKVSELTLVNVMLEAQIQDLQTQLNSITEQKTRENTVLYRKNRYEISNLSEGCTK